MRGGGGGGGRGVCVIERTGEKGREIERRERE